jgi:hypothetical protein
MIDQQHLERAKIDAKAATDLVRAGAQTAILINGGAATAILALVGSIAHDTGAGKTVLPLISFPLTIYALGVLFAACAFLPMSRALEWYMTNWEHGGKSEFGIRGERFWHVGLALIAAALFCFIFASIYVAYILGHIELPQSK